MSEHDWEWATEQGRAGATVRRPPSAGGKWHEHQRLILVFITDIDGDIENIYMDYMGTGRQLHPWPYNTADAAATDWEVCE